MMLVVFLIGVAPKEYLHDVLFHHHDTVDPVLKKGEVVMGNKHTHCAFLGFVFGPFISSEKQFISFRAVAVHTSYLLPVYHYHYFSAHNAVSLRGPPTGC